MFEDSVFFLDGAFYSVNIEELLCSEQDLTQENIGVQQPCLQEEKKSTKVNLWEYIIKKENDRYFFYDKVKANKICTDDFVKNYLNYVKSRKILNKQEEENLLKQCALGNVQARKEIVEAYAQCVVDAVSDYTIANFEIMDLLQAGNEGLLAAVQSFDLQCDTSFSVYAMKYIKKAIQEYVLHDNLLIQLPNTMIKVYQKIDKTYVSLFRSLERFPNVDELANKLKVDVTYICSLLDDMRTIDMMELKSDCFDEKVIYDFFDGALNDYLKEIIIKDLKRAFLCLTERQKEVIILRYGLYDNCYKTLETVGNQLGLTRERIRQIELQALKKLRKSSANLREYLEVL